MTDDCFGGSGVTTVPARRRWAGLAVVTAVLSIHEAQAAAQTSGESTHFIDGEFAVGGGTTYQYDGTSTSAIGAITWTWYGDRLELGAIRFADSQIHHARRRDTTVYAYPNWAFPISRRWAIVRKPNGEMFIGIGGAYKTETDEMNGSRLNFTEQLGWRFRPLLIGAARVEIALRHMSNAGLKKPNRGQDFITAAIVF
jgi:hypothetical protein